MQSEIRQETKETKCKLYVTGEMSDECCMFVCHKLKLYVCMQVEVKSVVCLCVTSFVCLCHGNQFVFCILVFCMYVSRVL